MLEKITRFATITLIAVMVWLYAEGATRKQHTVNFIVQFVAAQDQPLLISPPTQNVTATVRCATSQLDQIRSDAAETPIRIEVNNVPGQPEQTIDLDREFAVHSRVNRLGITIERVEPVSAPLRVEKLETRSVSIRLVTPPDLELAGPATLEPQVGQITLPASQLVNIEGVLELIAPLDQNALAGVVPGVPTDRDNIAVTLPPAMASMPDARFGPQKVKITFTVKKKEDEFVIGLVPVVLNIAPNLARQYDVTVDQENLLLRDIKIKGPSDMIARIKSGQFRVEALLRLDPEDLEKKLPSKLPELRLPAGVTPVSTLPLVKLTITKRESVPATP